MQRSQWAVGFVMMILGLLLTTQFRTQGQVPADLGRSRADELATTLRAAEQTLASSEAERARLSAELESLRQATAPAPPRDTTALEILAGTLELQGPGLVVILVEAPEVTSTLTRVSDEDLWRVLNELLAAGAEGLAVNGQRITALTGIRNVGQRVRVGDAMISSPVEVLAIGDPKVLEAAVLLRGGVVEVLGKWGIKVTVRRSDTIRIPALRGVPAFYHASPAVKPER